ncbi:hypothetical protein F4680DRAFT_417269 [Xylaria scruposa]|nr:hypothetical protein F4680DRAFT_417269 [Xylaria scruposa]
MARTKQTARPSIGERRISWTRFRLPLGQDLPKWPASCANAQVGPLYCVAGCMNAWLGRMVDDPEQAALIVLWRQLDALKKFQESPACAEFLQGLPEYDRDDAQASIVSGSSLRDLSLDDASSSLPLPLRQSRFLVFQDTEATPTVDVEGRVTLTALMIPRQEDSMRRTWYEAVKRVFDSFVPRGCEIITGRYPTPRPRYLAAWSWVLTEDAWVDKKFGQKEGDSGRTIICEFRTWKGNYDATPELEELSAKDPLARESWAQAVARVMPPVTAWVQERWDLRVYKLYSPEDEELEPEDPEYERQIAEFCAYHRPRLEAEGLL